MSRAPVVAIVASQTWAQPDTVRKFVRSLAKKYPDATLIAGDGGASLAALDEAEEMSLGVVRCGVTESGHAWKLTMSYTERTMSILGQVGLDYIDMLLEGDFGTAKAALLHRNTVIVQSADQVVAFWDRWSTGTRHAINHAHKLKRPVHIYHPDA